MGLQAYFESASKDMNFYGDWEAIYKMKDKANVTGRNQSFFSHNPKSQYDKLPVVEEAYFEYIHWLEYYFCHEFDVGACCEDGILLTEPDLAKLQSLLHKVIDSMDIRATRDPEYGLPEYRVENPDSCDKSLFRSYICEEFDDGYIWHLFRVNHAVDRLMKEFPWESRNLYYRSS